MLAIGTTAGRIAGLVVLAAVAVGCSEDAGPAEPAHIAADVAPTGSTEPAITPFEVSGSEWGVAAGINPQGDIVGTCFAAGQTHGFLRHGDTYTTFDVPGASETEALGINPQGDIVGVYTAGGLHGFLLHDGTFTALDFPGASETRAIGIDQQGDVVGYYYLGNPHGFLYH